MTQIYNSRQEGERPGVIIHSSSSVVAKQVAFVLQTFSFYPGMGPRDPLSPVFPFFLSPAMEFF